MAATQKDVDALRRIADRHFKGDEQDVKPEITDDDVQLVCAWTGYNGEKGGVKLECLKRVLQVILENRRGD